MDDTEPRGRFRRVRSTAGRIPRATLGGTRAATRVAIRRIEAAIDAVLERAISLNYDVSNAETAEDLLRSANENKSASSLGEMAQGQAIGRLTTLIAALAPLMRGSGAARRDGIKGVRFLHGPERDGDRRGHSGRRHRRSTPQRDHPWRLRARSPGVLPRSAHPRRRRCARGFADSICCHRDICRPGSSRAHCSTMERAPARNLAKRWIQGAAATGDPAKRQALSRQRIDAISRLPLG